MKAGIHSALGGMKCEVVHAGSRDAIQQLVELDESSAPTPWPAAQFRVELSKAHMTCLAATLDDGRIVGYAMVRIGHVKATVTDMLVHADHRRQGVGRQLLKCVDAKLLVGSRKAIELVVGERNLGVQNFLKACGIRGEFIPGDGDRDGFVIFLAPAGFSEGFPSKEA